MPNLNYHAVGIEQSFAMWENNDLIEGSFLFSVKEEDDAIEIYLNKNQILDLFNLMKNEIDIFEKKVSKYDI